MDRRSSATWWYWGRQTTSPEWKLASLRCRGAQLGCERGPAAGTNVSGTHPHGSRLTADSHQMLAVPVQAEDLAAEGGSATPGDGIGRRPDLLAAAARWSGRVTDREQPITTAHDVSEPGEDRVRLLARPVQSVGGPPDGPIAET